MIDFDALASTDEKPNCILYYGAPGCCKTTFGAFAPKPLFITTMSEYGIEKLKQNGLAPQGIPVQNVKTYDELMAFLRKLSAIDNLPFETLVIDTINGLQNMITDHIMKTKYGNDAAKWKSFGDGEQVTLKDWRHFLETVLDSIRVDKGLRVVLLAHDEQIKQKNSAGESEYFMQAPVSLRKLALALEQYPDFIIYAKRMPIIDDTKTKREIAKAPLTLYFNAGPGHMAKNRANLPDYAVVDGDSPEQVWGTFNKLMEGKV